jgi:hypothetical protein
MFALLLTALVAQASPLPSATPSASAAPTAAPSPATVPLSQPFVFVPPSDWTSMGMQGSLGAGDTQTTMVGMWGPSLRDGSSLSVAVASSQGLSLDAYITQSLAAYKTFSSYEPISTTPVSLCGGVRGKIVKSSLIALQRKLTISQLFTVNDGRAYIATYTRGSSVDSQPALDAMAALCPNGQPQVAASKAETLAPIAGPPGWKQNSIGNDDASNAAKLPSLWLWTNPASPPGSEVVEALMVPVPASAAFPPSSPAMNDFYVQTFERGMKLWASDIKIVEQKPIQLCQTSGISLRMTATAFLKSVELDVVLAPGTPTTYAAMYLRMKGVAENPDAVKAIDSLCPADRQVTTS